MFYASLKGSKFFQVKLKLSKHKEGSTYEGTSIHFYNNTLTLYQLW